MNPSFWLGKRVFLTGHTGFKGSWLALWLQAMGAHVYGYALKPPTIPNLFSIAKVADGLSAHHLADITDAACLRQALQDSKADIVLHLAAQALVRDSYLQPVKTYATNVMGTVHLLEAVRAAPSVKAVVIVTTDKCYENKEWLWGYRENEALGGFDPYASSKACAELVTAAYRQAFFADSPVALASARAGNVIGGGDFAKDRLIPDFLRAADAGEILNIRSPEATRPWQHVLEPLSGYLALAERLFVEGKGFAEGWNFGPVDADARSVQWLVSNLANLRSDVKSQVTTTPGVHEAHYLKLDSSKARQRLHWQPRLRLYQALQQTIIWHQAFRSGEDMRQFSLTQIAEYQATPGLD